MSERYPHRWEFHGLTNGRLLIMQCRCGATSPNPLPEKFHMDCPAAVKDGDCEPVEMDSKQR